MAEDIKREGSAINFHYKKLGEMSEEELGSGNVTKCQNPTVLRKIISDVVRQEKLHQDLIQELILLKTVYRDEDDSDGPVTGYIQYIGASPFCIAMYCKQQMDLIKSLSDQNKLNLYFDATGSVVFKIPNEKRHLLYSLVVKPSENIPPVSVADLLTTDHTIPEILHFLSSLKRSAQLCGVTTWNKIETDWSYAIIQASIQTFNFMNLKEYLSSAMSVIMREKASSFIKTFTVVHICAAHMIRTFSRNISSHTSKKKDLKHFALQCFAYLQNTTNISSAKTFFSSMCVVLGNKKVTGLVEDNLSKMKETIKGCIWASEEYVIEETDIEALSTPEEIGYEETSIRDASKFTRIFKIILSDSEQQDGEGKDNPYWCQDILHILVEKYFPIFPLWSGVLLGDLVRYDKASELPDIIDLQTRDTNSCVEGWFKIIKVDSAQKKRQRPSEFVRNLSTTIKARIKEAKFPKLRAKPPKKSTATPVEASEEMWNKKKRRKSIYHRTDKLVKAQTDDHISKTVVKKSRGHESPVQYPPVPAWGGRLKHYKTKLVNTCTIDNGLTMLYLIFQEREVFRNVLEDFIDKSGKHKKVVEVVVMCCTLMDEREFSEAKALWISEILNMRIKGVVDVFDSEWDAFASALSDMSVSSLTSNCSSQNCPQKRRKKSCCRGITLTAPKSSSKIVNIDDLISSWSCPENSRCGAKFDTSVKDVTNYFTEKVEEFNEQGEASIKEYRYCSGLRKYKRRVTEYPPVIILPVADIVSTGTLSSEIRKYSKNVRVGCSEYTLIGGSFHCPGHFTSAINTSRHGWLFYDGLNTCTDKEGKEMGQLAKLEKQTLNSTIEHLLFIRVP